MKHHPEGPSSLGLLYRCPGSRREREKYPPRESEDAKEGTRLHGLIAEKLRGAEIDDPMVVRCHDFACEQGLALAKSVLIEETLETLDGRFGTCDLIMTFEDRVVVIDWKTGPGKLDEIAARFQLADYCFGAELVSGVPAEGWIYNPRQDERYHYRHEHPEKAKDSILAVLEVSREPDAPLKAGTWCRWCSAAGLCPETAGAVEALSREVPVPAGGSQKEKQKALKSQLDSLPAERLLPVLELAGVVSLAIDAVRERARECLEQDPDCLPGWILKETNGQRVADAMELYEALKDEVTPDEFMSVVKASPAALEKVFVEKQEGTKADAKRRYQELTREVVRQPRVKKLERS